MDYRRFTELRAPECDAFARDLEAARRRPREVDYEHLEELALRYRRILHDHALARARFPGTAMARRLQRLAVEGTHQLQRDRGENLLSLRRFLFQVFPAAFRRTLPGISATFWLFAIAASLGFAMASVQPALGSAFLPAESLEGLANGELWTESIFAVTPGALISSQIATNNLSVAITGWAGGALAGIGAIYIVLLNGLMLGAVIAVTAQWGMAAPLLEFISAHGPLEISLILVTAGAGLMIGRALIEAHDQPRSERLREAGLDAVTVLGGSLPWILLLGFVEGYLSPSPAVPPAIKFAVGVSLLCLFGVFAWGPIRFQESTPEERRA